MKYISKIHALNLPCSLNTVGDWHTSSLYWDKLPLLESESSIFGDYGIEKCNTVPEHTGEHYCANTLRALLDLLVDGELDIAQGARKQYIDNEEYTNEFIGKVWQLRGQTNWKDIDSFMLREYNCDWLNFKELKGEVQKLQSTPIKGSDIVFNDWRDLHLRIIQSFVSYLNNVTHSYVLKGGTSLMLCYGLNRFSEGIDLDGYGTIKGIEPIINNFCAMNGYIFRISKDTSTTKRYFIHYESTKPLKIEISYRRSSIRPDEVTIINGIFVYTLQRILSFKVNAFNSRDKIRDLFDIVFICTNYWKILDLSLLDLVRNAFEYKGLDYVEALVRTQTDSLIDPNALIEGYLNVYYALGLR